MSIIRLAVCFFVPLALIGCDQAISFSEKYQAKVSSTELEQFVRSVKDDLVFIEGGEFWMGDYGSLYGKEKLPYDSDKDSKPLHKVELSGYSVDRFKITNKNFQFYLRYNDLALRVIGGGNQSTWEEINSMPDNPAHMDWYEAERYCNWLASITDLPFALLTEAQWEYAARSRGQFLMVATDDGTYKATRAPSTEFDGSRGINISTSWDREAFAKEMGWKTAEVTPLPVDRFPPNPIGLYAMSDNGWEWVQDWYDPNYYQYSPVKDPQGPKKPVYKDYYGRDMKVARGQSYANPAWGGGVNVHRTKAEPYGYVKNKGLVVLIAKTARCAVNSSKPVI